MKRRDFLKKATLTSAGAFVAPYILPSGRLFAPTGTQIAPHVVLIMYAGGIRNQETVDQLYLQQSQFTHNPTPTLNVTGNIIFLDEMGNIQSNIPNQERFLKFYKDVSNIKINLKKYNTYVSFVSNLRMI